MEVVSARRMGLEEVLLFRVLGEDSHILDKATLNSLDKNPLHMAATFASVEFVRAVISFCPDLCWACDRFGRLPLHLAAIKGRLNVVQELVQALPIAARERTNGGGNVLHLCVKYNQLKALKFLVQRIQADDFANQKVMNAKGRTPLDLFREGVNDSEIGLILQRAGAKRDKDVESCETTGNEWLRKKRESIMVVASLIATMAFQAGVNQAGGVWQEDNLDGPNPHVAGTAVMAHKRPRYYEYFLWTNSVAFVSSLSTILFLISGMPFRNKFFLWVLMVIMWLTVTDIALTYGISIEIVTSRDSKKQLSQVIKTSVTLWCCVMFFLMVGNTIRLLNRWLIRRHGIDLFKNLRTSDENSKSRAQVQNNCEDDYSI